MAFKGLFKGKGGNGAATPPQEPAQAAAPAAIDPVPAALSSAAHVEAPLAPPPAEAAVAAAAPPLTPEMLAKIAELRGRIQLSVGQVVLAVMNLPRYRHQSLADLAHIIVEPLLRDRVAIAHRSVKADDGTVKIDEDTVAGIAIWATVSDAVDAKITEQVRAGTFPVRLAAEEWRSGETVWLLDVIAADRRQATSVLANFRQLAGQRPVRIHPLVARLIEPEVLEKLKAAAV